jgi:hypothetical protein
MTARIKIDMIIDRAACITHPTLMGCTVDNERRRCLLFAFNPVFRFRARNSPNGGNNSPVRG